MTLEQEEQPTQSRVIAIIVAVAFLPAASVALAQNIVGNVLTAQELPARDFLVTVMDAANAELMASATTDFEGSYDTGLISTGNSLISSWWTRSTASIFRTASMRC